MTSGHFSNASFDSLKKTTASIDESQGHAMKVTLQFKRKEDNPWTHRNERYKKERRPKNTGQATGVTKLRAAER